MRHKKAEVRVRRYLTLDCELEQGTVQHADWQDSEQLLVPIFLRTCFDPLLRQTYGERESLRTFAGTIAARIIC